MHPLGCQKIHGECLTGGTWLQNCQPRYGGKQLGREYSGQCTGRCVMLKKLWALKLLGTEEAMCALEELVLAGA